MSAQTPPEFSSKTIKTKTPIVFLILFLILLYYFASLLYTPHFLSPQFTQTLYHFFLFIPILPLKPFLPLFPMFSPIRPSSLNPTLSSSVKFRPRILTRASVSTFAEPTRIKPAARTSLYQILRVDQTASQMEIKTAYRSLAKLYHPDAAIHEDAAHSDGHDFIEIHNAYETLSDPGSRALYDLTLSAAVASGGYYERTRRRASGFSGGFYRTRRWETDQCW